jgi:hypothetical protein
LAYGHNRLGNLRCALRIYLGNAVRVGPRTGCKPKPRSRNFKAGRLLVLTGRLIQQNQFHTEHHEGALSIIPAHLQIEARNRLGIPFWRRDYWEAQAGPNQIRCETCRQGHSARRRIHPGGSADSRTARRTFFPRGSRLYISKGASFSSAARPDRDEMALGGTVCEVSPDSLFAQP